MMHKEHQCQIRFSNSLVDSTMTTPREYIFEEEKQSMYFPLIAYLFLETNRIVLYLLRQSCFQKLKEMNLIYAKLQPNSFSKFRRILKSMVPQAVKTSQVIKESIQLGLFLAGLDTREGRVIITIFEHLGITGKHLCILFKIISSKKKSFKKVIK